MDEVTAYLQAAALILGSVLNAILAYEAYENGWKIWKLVTLVVTALVFAGGAIFKLYIAPS